MENMADVDLVSVFTLDGRGGNFCPIVVDARKMTVADMQAVAQRYGHEAGFVLPSDSPDADFRFRFFVPNHEMEMCGHATIGALWLLARAGRLGDSTVRIETRSGPVTGYVSAVGDSDPEVHITQPAGKVTKLGREDEAAVLSALAIDRESLACQPICNAVTSRTKTLVPLRDQKVLQSIRAEMPAVEATCRRINSTGLYPFAVVDKEARLFEARQFPRSSGYVEDAATGVAAAALAFGLLQYKLIAADDRVVRILQGRALGRLSEIRVSVGFSAGRATGCLVAGAVTHVEPTERPVS